MDIPQVPVSCPVCGDASDSAREAMTVYSLEVPGATVCRTCAERIANTFHKRNAGRWLTWENAPVLPRRKAVIPAELRTAVFERDAYRCVECRAHIDLTCDHIIPESKGGPTTLENLRTLCRSCNSRRGARE